MDLQFSQRETHHNMSVHKVHIETLKATVAEPEVALRSWNWLIQEIGFDDLPNSTIRFLPRIYLNLRNLPRVPEFNRIRGTYKLNRARNTRLLFQIFPIFQQLRESSIEFRGIKGLAVGALSKKLNSRVLGDVDLLFRKDDISRVKAVLDQFSFSLRDEHSPLGIQALGSYVNADGANLDIHAVESLPYWSPIRFESTVETIVDKHTLIVPEPISLALHAVGHGIEGSSESDLLQSAVDFLDLLPLRVQSDFIQSFHSVSRTLNVSTFISLLEDAKVLPDTLLGQIALATSSGVAGPNLREKRRTQWEKLLMSPVLIWRRRLGVTECRILAVLTLQHPQLIPYALWMMLGQFKALERAFFKAGVRLAQPAKLFSDGGPCSSRDYRVVINHTNQEKGLTMLHIVADKNQDALGQRERSVSVNGNPFGFFPVDGICEARYLMPSDSKFFEVSLRSHHRKPVVQFSSLQASVSTVQLRKSAL